MTIESITNLNTNFNHILKEYETRKYSNELESIQQADIIKKTIMESIRDYLKDFLYYSEFEIDLNNYQNKLDIVRKLVMNIRTDFADIPFAFTTICLDFIEVCIIQVDSLTNSKSSNFDYVKGYLQGLTNSLTYIIM